MSTPSSPPRFFTLIAISALTVLSLNMFLPSLPAMALEFETSYAMVSLSFSGFLAVTAIGQLIAGPLSDRFGRRPVMLGSLAVFFAASIGCALSQTVESFLMFRVLQCSIAGGWAIPRTVIRDTHSEARAAALLGTMGMVMAVAPMLGPTFGGLLETVFGWRASFWFFALVSGALLVLCWVDMGETNAAPSTSILGQFRSYPDLLGERRFWAFAVMIGGSTGAFYAFLGGGPLVAARVYGLSPTQVGILIGSITGGFALGNFVASRLATRMSLTRLMLIGRVTGTVALCIAIVAAVSDVLPLPLLGICMIATGIGNGITLPAANAGVLSVVPKLAGSASGISGAVQVSIGAITSALAGLVAGGAYGAVAVIAVMFASTLTALACAVYLYTRPMALPPGTGPNPA